MNAYYFIGCLVSLAFAVGLLIGRVLFYGRDGSYRGGDNFNKGIAVAWILLSTSGAVLFAKQLFSAEKKSPHGPER